MKRGVCRGFGEVGSVCDIRVFVVELIWFDWTAGWIIGLLGGFIGFELKFDGNYFFGVLRVLRAGFVY